MPRLKQDDFLKETIASCKKGFYFIILLSFFINLSMLIVPLYSLQMFDRVVMGHSPETLIYLTLISFFMIFVFGIMDVIRSATMIQLNNWLENKLSPRALTYCPDHILQGYSYGTQCLRDIAQVRQFLCGPSAFSFLDTPWSIVFLSIVFLLNYVLGFIAVFGVVVLFGIAILNEIITRKPLVESGSSLLKNQRRIDTAIRNADVIQGMGMMPALVKKWVADNEIVLTLQGQANRVGASIMAFSKSFRMMIQLSVLGVGAYFVMEGHFTTGGMIAASIIAARALSPIEQSINSWKQMIAAQQAYHRLQVYFSHVASRQPGITLPPPEGSIGVTNLTYVPPGGHKPALSNVSFQIKPGEMVAVLGPTAAGKSTLLKLLVGSLKGTTGTVRLDGADVYEWDRADFGRYVGYLPQDVELFPGTVRQNISRMREASSEEVIAAAKLVGVHELILTFPDGYETLLEAGDFHLSGGQQQLIAMARALFGSPSLLVLDEPNSNLDNAGEQLVIEALSHMKAQGKTIVLVTHRTSLIRDVEKILILFEGTLRAFGDRDLVLQKLQEQGISI